MAGMHPDHIFFYCGDQAIEQLAAYCRSHAYQRFMLICDTNTWTALGERVEKFLRGEGWDVLMVVLQGQPVVPDENYLTQVFWQADDQPRVYLAVGSGTITDIARFCSHRSRNPFIALPTAPSVDGFTSLIAALVVGGFKGNAYAQPPIAVFADLPTLCAAPHAMIAAGFGDMLGKYIALADWKLGNLLWDTPYNPQIAARMEKALQKCVDYAAEIRQATPQGISALMEGLVESGICMLLNGNSLPASGAEHHISHYWEMKLLRQNRPAVLHGAKVGVGTLLMAERYQTIRGLSRGEVQSRLDHSSLPERHLELEAIRKSWGPLAGQVETEQRRFLDMTAEDYAQLKDKIYRHWDEIVRIAAGVPPAETVAALLTQVGAPTQASMLGLDQADQAEALGLAHYLRGQFTVSKLGRVLGLW